MKRVIFLFCLAAMTVGGVCNLRAEEAAPPPALNVPAAAVNVTDPAAATQAWLDTVPADKRARSDAYFEGGYWLLLWDFLLSAAILIFILSSRISARLRDWAERTTRFKAMQIVLYAIPFILLSSVLTFPLAAYEGFFREHQYGMATQTFGPWFGEQLIGLAVLLIGLSIFLVVLYAVFRRAPRSHGEAA